MVAASVGIVVSEISEAELYDADVIAAAVCMANITMVILTMNGEKILISAAMIGMTAVATVTIENSVVVAVQSVDFDGS